MRRQRPRGSTTREAVVNAALAVLDEVGIEALTIRAVARRVDAPAMTLYTHFDTKEALLDLMYKELARRLYGDHDNPTWQAELLAVVHHIRAVLLEHPRWTPLFTRQAPPPDVPVRERVLGLMIAEGMSPERALAGLTGGIVMAVALATLELSLTAPDGEWTISKRFAAVKSLMAGQTQPEYPATQAAFSRHEGFTPSDNFDFVMKSFVAGLEATKHD